MLHLLKRHPLPIKAFFKHSLVLTFAYPKEVLLPLLPPGLILDTYGDYGFLAIAMVQTRGLRPAFLPEWMGKDFFLTGYRIFSRFKTKEGRTLRGLRILRSDTDKELMVLFGNLLTHYHYRKAKVEMREEGQKLEFKITTPQQEADLHVRVKLAGEAQLPPGSPFSDLKEARKFAGPLPFTFDYEKETHSIVRIEGVRQDWNPKPVQVEILQNSFLEKAPFAGHTPLLANAFHIQNIPYLWKPGIREVLSSEVENG